MAEDPESIVDRLTRKMASIFAGRHREQIDAWRETLHSLRLSLPSMPQVSGILLEYPLLRLDRRIDLILLVGPHVIVVEVKAGSSNSDSAARAQVEDYALCLRDFHRPSQGRHIVPVVAAGGGFALQAPPQLTFLEGVSRTIDTNLGSLPHVVATTSLIHSTHPSLGLPEFDAGAYSPTPTIVEAAREAYALHANPQIRRSDASATTLMSTASQLSRIALRTREASSHAICFVTGTPGAGKTLLGLDLVLGQAPGTVAGEPAAFLSGNRPLVKVLQQALIDDSAKHQNTSKKEAARKVEGTIQTLLAYLRQHADETSAQPPEHVVVFDEAQRAWDADTGQKLLGRNQSEPALFLDILGRLPWACLVCLVGPGQEINRGEKGLSLWFDAIDSANEGGAQWTTYTAPLSRRGLSSQLSNRVHLIDSLCLEGSIRAYRNPKQTAWVSAVLRSNLNEAEKLAASMTSPPATLFRSLSDAKAWARQRQRGNRRVGLLASSNAVRLRAEGLPPSPLSNDLSAIAHWFLKPTEDFRSSQSLEVPLSEFAVQGLELDYPIICWGGDLVWQDQWVPRKMRAPKWTTLKNKDMRGYRLNAYRVLLTRARMEQAIYVPKGDGGDPTRSQTLFDSTAEALLKAGCLPGDAI